MDISRRTYSWFSLGAQQARLSTMESPQYMSCIEMGVPDNTIARRPPYLLRENFQAELEYHRMKWITNFYSE